MFSFFKFSSALAFGLMMTPQVHAVELCPGGERAVELHGIVRDVQTMLTTGGTTTCSYRIQVLMVPEPVENPQCPFDRSEVGEYTFSDPSCTVRDGSPISGTAVLKNGAATLE